MKKYIAMEMKVVNFCEEDAIRTSGITTPVGDEIISDPFDEVNFGG